MLAAARRADAHTTSYAADVSPMRTLRFAVLLLLPPALAAAQPAQRDTVVCGDASARRPAENVADDFTRLLQLTGDAPARAALFRRGADRLAVPCGAARPYGERWYDAPPDTLLSLVPVRAVLAGNTGYPRGMNDGALWSGAGAAGMVRGGVLFRYGPLTAALAPELAIASNGSFDRPAPRTAALSPFAYPWHGGTIDWPDRHGAGTWTAIEPGQSFVRVDAYGFAAGVSTENLWWGPSLYNPMLFGNSAPGFPHVFAGTGRPLDVGIGALDVELLWGRVTESEFYDADPDNDHRLIAGLIVDFEPVFAPGLYLGFARTFLTTIPPSGFGIDDFFLRPYRGLRDNVPDAYAGDNQLISVFGRFVAPGAGLEAWAEWARDDHWEDLEDLAKQPDHSQVYTFGVQKVFENDDALLRIYGELTHLQAAITLRSFRPGSVFYTNGSVRQGYTHRGQLLGAGIGPGSDMQIVGADWLADWGRSGLFLQRTRFDDDAYYANYARFYGQNGHDVELTAGVRQRLFIGPLDVDGEVTFSHRYNRNFVGFEAGSFDALFSENNWGIRLVATWVPRLPWTLPSTTPAPQ
jgi:hypothetical protein